MYVMYSDLSAFLVTHPCSYRQIDCGGSSAWDLVASRLAPPMLMLTRVHNLPKILPDSKLPPFIKEELHQQYKLAMQQENKAAKAHAAGRENASSDDSSSSDRDPDLAEHRCTLCRKKKQEVCPDHR